MNKQTFGQRLKHRRETLALTQERVSELITDLVGDKILSKSSISHLEHDRHDPSIQALRALTEVLQTSLNWLILGEDGKGEIVDNISFWAARVPESKQRLLESIARDFFTSTVAEPPTASS